jgi:hypothetical protein|tara:strand:- start:1413 stop:1691 length:279 start_codon:yes stop_codon:yes gene_type:complete
MARYPELPKFINTEAEAKEFYEYIQQWGAALINELETRDTQVNANPSSNIYTVVTITEIGSPQRGDIAYAASAGKFKGYVSTTATQAWENLN